MEMSYTFTDNYFALIRNLGSQAKLELINKISNSLLEKQVSKKEQLLKAFGSWVSDKSAEEIVFEVKNARYFREKEFAL